MEYGIIAFQSDSACSLLIEYDSLKKDEKDYINGCYGIDALYLDSDEEGKDDWFSFLEVPRYKDDPDYYKDKTCNC